MSSKNFIVNVISTVYFGKCYSKSYLFHLNFYKGESFAAKNFQKLVNEEMALAWTSKQVLNVLIGA